MKGIPHPFNTPTPTLEPASLLEDTRELGGSEVWLRAGKETGTSKDHEFATNRSIDVICQLFKYISRLLITLSAN